MKDFIPLTTVADFPDIYKAHSEAQNLLRYAIESPQGAPRFFIEHRNGTYGITRNLDFAGPIQEKNWQALAQHFAHSA